MPDQKRYSGIGSREAPPAILRLMTHIASFMESQGYILCSGGANGSDSAFEEGVTDPEMKNIFIPWKGFNRSTSLLYSITAEAYTMAEKFHPSWKGLSDPVKNIMARNCYQVLGLSLDKPVDMVVCYTPHGKAEGGTGQALRIASYYSVPIFNLYYTKDIDKILSWIKDGKISLIKKLEIESWKLI